MKILICVEERRLGGGIAASSVNFANELTRRGHDVHYLIMKKSFHPYELLNPDIKILHFTGLTAYWNVGIEDIRNAHGFEKIKKSMALFIKYLCGRLKIWDKVIFSFQKNEEYYDVAIAFRQSHYSYYYVSKCISANLKLGFVHVDLVNNPTIVNLIDDMKKMDKIAYVSDAVRDDFVKHFPELKNSACTIYNLFNADFIYERMTEPVTEKPSEDVFRIVTVSRIENSQKRIDLIPEVCRELKNRNVNFEWIIIGEGPDLEKDIAISEEYQVNDVLRFVGKQMNPYSWLHSADISVLTSSCESFGMVVVESIITGTPVVVTEYPALKEILTDSRMGLVAEQTVESIVENILKYYNNNDGLLTASRDFLSLYRYSSDTAYEQFMRAVERNDT